MFELLLAQQRLDTRGQCHRLVDHRVGACPIRAEPHQIGHVGPGCQDGARPPGQRAFVGAVAAGHRTGQRPQHVHRWVAAGLRNATIDYQVAVQRAAHGVGHRLVVVVALDQHVEQRGDLPGGAVGALLTGSGALQKAWQFGKTLGDSRGGRRFPGGEADFAQREAERVTLSIISSTDLPSSRKCSAIVMAA